VSAIITSTPRRTNTSASAKPIPLVPPVTTATWLGSICMMFRPPGLA
jgi:hypothetical protein